jgi:undecaprenyl diphosphate synthase
MRRVRPRPAAGLTIIVHGTARERTCAHEGSVQIETAPTAPRVASANVVHLDPSHIPAHVAIVMDGNGRWAQRRGLKRTEGHAAGEEALFDTAYGALDVGVEWLTVFAFSTENWRRPLDEVRFLMNFNERLLLERREELHERGVRVRFIGRRGGRVPARVRRRIEETEGLTRRNRAMTLTFAFNYGGRAELVDAAREIASEVAAGRLDPRHIDERTFRRHLYAPDMPEPDLLVRTSGEFRISNYLLWELAYSELYFTDVLWPDFRREHLFEAIADYQKRDRRYGGV